VEPLGPGGGTTNDQNYGRLRGNWVWSDLSSKKRKSERGTGRVARPGGGGVMRGVRQINEKVARLRGGGEKEEKEGVNRKKKDKKGRRGLGRGGSERVKVNQFCGEEELGLTGKKR